MNRTNRTHLLPLLALALSAAACAIQGDASPDGPAAGSDEAALSSSKDASLKKLLADVAKDGRLELAESDAIVAEVLRGGMTSSTLRTAVAFFLAPPKDVEKRPDGQVGADAGGLSTLENMYFGMPRNVSSMSGTGQSMVESTTETSTEFFFGETPKAPVQIRFSGTAKHAYTLSFRVLEKPVSVAIPAGSTAAGTASLVAAALDGAEKDILDSEQDPHVIDFQSDTSLIGLHADAAGDTVSVTLDEDA
jgi:hypothetical protein